MGEVQASNIGHKTMLLYTCHIGSNHNITGSVDGGSVTRKTGTVPTLANDRAAYHQSAPLKINRGLSTIETTNPTRH